MFLADSYPMLDVFWTMLVLFGFVVWLMLIVIVFADIVRRHDIGGLVKAAWTVLILILPLAGVLIYLVVEARNMPDRRAGHRHLDAARLPAQVGLGERGGPRTQAQLDRPHPLA